MKAICIVAPAAAVEFKPKEVKKETKNVKKARN